MSSQVRVKKILDVALAEVGNKHSQMKREIPPAENKSCVSSKRVNRVTRVMMTASFGSFGDQALAAGTSEVGRSSGTPLQFLVPGAADPWATIAGDPFASLDPLAHGPTFWTKARGRAVFASGPLTVIGADTIGGDYEHRFLAFRIRALNATASAGHSAKLVNFSLSEQPSRTAIGFLRTLAPAVELWARDTLSKSRAEALLKRQINLAPDVGVFMNPSVNDETNEDPRRIVLVPNAHVATLFGVEREELLTYWVKLAQRLQDKWTVVLMPHDIRPNPNDIGFCHEIARRIGTGKYISVFVPTDAAEAKRFIGSSGSCISARMHACVGSLSMGTPTVGLDYLQKFEGQFSWFGELGQTIDFADALNLNKTLATLENVRHKTSTVSPKSSDIAWIKSDI